MDIGMIKDDLADRARTAVQGLLDGGPAEDSFFEFKSVFPELTDPESTAKAARQLAAQANAAMPEPIIWIVGVDEKANKIIGAGKKELSNWYSRITKSFDGSSPRLSRSVILHEFDKPIVAVLFETDDAPYVVNLPNSRDRVVPWREATGHRCASRAELLALLQHHTRLPASHIIGGSKKTSIIAHARQCSDDWSIRLRLTLFLENQVSKRVILPVHSCSGWFEAHGLIERTSFTECQFKVQKKPVSQVIVKDVEEVEVCAGAVVKIAEPREVSAGFELLFGVVGAKKPLVVRAELPLRVQRSMSLSQMQMQTQQKQRAKYP